MKTLLLLLQAVVARLYPISLSVLLIFCFSIPASALNYYWVGGSGNWSDHENHWATSSGGTEFHDQVPQSMDNVFFDANSFPTGGTVTIDPTIIYCLNMDWTGAGNVPVFYCPSNKQVWIFGSLTLIEEMEWQINGEVHFRAFEGGKTIRTNGQTFISSIYFDGDGGGWDFLDSFSTTGWYTYHNAGTIRTNGNPVSFGNFSSNGDSLFLDNSTILITNNYFNSYATFLDAGTSHLIFSYWGYLQTAYNQSFHDVTFIYPFSSGYVYSCNINGKLTFWGEGQYSGNGTTINEVEFQQNGLISAYSTFNITSFLDNGQIYGNNSFSTLNLSPGHLYQFEPGAETTILPGGTFNASGPGCNNYNILLSTASGAASNLNTSGANLALQYVTVADIAVTGGGTITAINSIDLGGNSGWVFTPPPSRNLYWVGGEGNWSDLSHWALSSGGTGGECIPSAFDNVFFDQNSGFSSPGQQVIVDDDIAFCHDMTWQDVQNSPVFTAASSDFQLYIFGSLTFDPGMFLNLPAQVHFRASQPGQTILMANQTFSSDVYFDGDGGGWNFLDSFSTTGWYTYHNAGTIRTNGNPVSFGNFSSNGDSLFLDNSTILITNNYFNSYATFLDAGTSHLIFSYWGYLQTAYNQSFHDVTFIYPFSSGYVYSCNINGKLTFWGEGQYSGNGTTINEVEFQQNGLISAYSTFNITSFLDNGQIYGNNSFSTLNLSPGHLYQFEPGAETTILPGGTFNASGPGCNNYNILLSTASGAASNLNTSGANLALQYVTVADIAVTGGGTITAINSIDLGGNSGWVFTPPPSRNLYWVGGEGNWSDLSHWALSSGGTGGECIPSAFDNVFFDQNSGFSSPGQQVIVDDDIAFCHDMTWQDVQNSPVFTAASSDFQLYIFGSLTFDPGMFLNLPAQVHFRASQPGQTILMANQTFSSDVYFDGDGGGWNFLDSFSTTGWYTYHNAGTIRTNGNPVSFGNFSSNGDSLFLDNSTILITNNYFNSYATFLDAGTSHLIFSYWGYLQTAYNQSFHDVTFIYPFSSGYVYSCNINGKLTFWGEGQYSGNGTTINEVEFQQNGLISAYSTFNITSFLDNGQIYGYNFFDQLTFSPGKTYILESGSTQTISPLGNFIAEGTGSFPIEIKSNQSGSQATLHKDGDPICLDFLYLTDMAATGSGFSYAGANSDDVNNNSGWIFEACPECFTGPPAPAPALDPASITTVFSGEQITLILANLPTGYEAVWFDETQANEVYASTDNFFQTVVFNNTTFYGAFRELATGCISELLEVPVTAIICELFAQPTSNSPICIGENLTLFETGTTGAISWQWSGPNNFSSTLQNPVIPDATAANQGTYWVTVTDSQGCMDSAYTFVQTFFALFCPPNQTISCDTYLDNYAAGVAQGDYSILDGLGVPVYCPNIIDTLFAVYVSLNNCTDGHITRTWTVTDPANNQFSCTQTIIVYHISDFVVVFPPDFYGECVNGELQDLGEPQVFFDDCELVGVSHQDQIINTAGQDACYVILREWTVINWCIYDNYGYNAFGEYPECSTGVDYDGDGDFDCLTYQDGWNWTGFPGTPDGFIIHTQVISIIDNTPPAFSIQPIDGCITGTECTKDLVLPYPGIFDGCSPSFDVDIIGDFGIYSNITGAIIIPNVGVGEYEIIYAVTDYCGNTGYQTITVLVEDCSPPTPLCTGPLAIELPCSGMVEVLASLMDNGSFDNCGPIASFSFSSDVNDIGRVFTENDLGNHPVQLWVTDIYGNQAFCETSILIQNDIPYPEMQTPASQVVCNGDLTAQVNFTGNHPDVVFNWTNDNPSIGLAAGGVGNIPAFSAINTSNGAVQATITVTPQSIECEGVPISFTITVNPVPVINQAPNQDICGGDPSSPITFTSPVPGTIVSWTNDNTSIGLAASGTGNILPFTTVNNTGAIQIATITALPSFTNAGITCSGDPVSFTITVYPPTTADAGPDQEICQDQTANLSATIGGLATTGTWSGGLGAFSNPNGLNTSYTPDPGEYGATITLTFTTNDPAGPCPAASDQLELTINTLPIVFAGDDLTICQGDVLNLLSLQAAILDTVGAGVSTGTWSSSGTGVFQPDNSFPPGAVTYQPSAADVAAGSVVITLTSADPAGPCGPVSDSFILTFKGDEPVVCNDTVFVSLDGTGVSEIFPDMVLESDYYYPLFIVELFDGINSVGNSVDCGDIGKVLTAKVTDICTGNFCWSHVKTEDKWAPTVWCVDDSISCEIDYNLLPFPSTTDNCDPDPQVELVNLTVADDEICPDNLMIVLREFKAIDQYGNKSAVCTQTIEISRPLPSSLDFPDDIEWDCSLYNEYPNIIEGKPFTGDLSLTGSGAPGNISAYYCMYNITYTDQVIPLCGNSFRIVRTWAVFDLCQNVAINSNDLGEDNVQIINVTDNTPPVVELASYTVSANIPGGSPGSCLSTGFLPPATITDDCNEWTVRIFTPDGEADYANGTDGSAGGFIPPPGLELGFHTIHYRAEDACGNVTSLFVPIEVADNIAPVAICDEITDTNLSSDGLAVILAETFNDGSYDNCCLEYFQVRRMDGDCEGNYDDFGPTVTFCCTDAGSSVMVIFQALDCYGNHNECMVSVNVNDKVPPIIISCPAPVTITCDDYLDNLAAAIANEDYSVLEQYGEPLFYDNCQLDVTYTVTQNINNCSEGTITRSWSASDGTNQPVICNQTIFVNHVSDWVVEFPADVTVQCTDGQLPDTGEPEIFFDECELIAVSYEDQTFTVVPDACYKIERVWTIINWCVYEEFGSNLYSEANYAESNLNVDWDGDGDRDNRTFRDGFNSSGAPGVADGYISFKQVIKVTDTEDPTFEVPAIDGCIVEADCDKNLVLPFPVITDECSIEYDVDITGDFGTFNDISGDVTIPDVGVGEYEVTYAVTDNCGNTGYQTITVVVEDCKNPTPLCDNGLVVEIMQTQMVTVNAEAFDEGSFDNCGPIAHFSYSSDITDTEQIFDCDDVAAGQISVQIWVTDIYGNQDFCSTVLFVQDNMGFCGGGAPIIVIAGAIETEGSDGVEGVTVEMNGGLLTQVTGLDGQYDFSVVAGNDYSVTPMLDENASNGVTTYDMVLITRHILNVALLNSPYKIIAADANKSGTVTTLDLVAIRKVILFVEDNFPNNTSWRFVDKDFTFPNPQNPWAATFPEVINYNNLAASDLAADFVAIKIGDVNGSAATTLDGQAEQRTMMGDLLFHTKDMELKAGQVYQIPFYGNDQEVYGYQFTMELGEGIELLDVAEGLAKAENFGFALLEEGALTTSWNEAEARVLGSEQAVFTLVIKARENTTLSKELSASSRYTAAEAYGANGELLNVQLTFGNEVAAGFELYQNIPNPFTGVTRIGFRLPEPAAATLTIMDASGKVVRVVKGDFGKGYNEVSLSDFGGVSGLLYYRLDTPTHSATRKMVVVMRK